MARYEGATWLPLPENETQARIRPTQVILHTAACRCGDSLHDDFNRPGNNLESHFFVQDDGGVEQYLDTEVHADANYRANARAVSIETQDDGDSTKPWSPAQELALAGLLIWLWRTHPAIAVDICRTWDAPGVGHHTMFGAPSPWTPVAKSCPGPARKAQFTALVWRSAAAHAAQHSGSWEQTWMPPAGLGQVSIDDPTVPTWYKQGFGDYASWAAIYRP